MACHPGSLELYASTNFENEQRVSGPGAVGYQSHSRPICGPYPHLLRVLDINFRYEKQECFSSIVFRCKLTGTLSFFQLELQPATMLNGHEAVLSRSKSCSYVLSPPPSPENHYSRSGYLVYGVPAPCFPFSEEIGKIHYEIYDRKSTTALHQSGPRPPPSISH